MRCDHAINEIKDPENNNYNNCYNYINNIENNLINREKELFDYTKKNLLKLVNLHFNCNYKELYFSDILSCDDLKNNLINK